MPNKILIIEDKTCFRELITFSLQSEGYEVCTASNGKDGVKVAREQKPDLILCDVMMPGLDGYGVIRTLRRDPAFATTPFIFLTAKGNRNDVRTGMNSGADDYLNKPVPHDELMAAVRSRLVRAGAVKQVIEASGAFTIDFDNHSPLIAAWGLTPREAEVLSWVAQGKGNADIAILLGIKESTVKQHVSTCYQKTGAENRSSAAMIVAEVLMACPPATQD
jgi:DNA-binding NarL/FixJ family response regulator